MHLQPIFSDFFFHEIIDLNTHHMKEEILEIEKKERNAAFHETGFQSSSVLHINTLQPLINHIKGRLPKLLDQLCYKFVSAEVADMWANVNRHKEFNRPHLHSQSNFSGVFYVDVPPDSGKLAFERHDLYFHMIQSRMRVNEYNQYNSPLWFVPSQNNMLVIFPSYLRHDVGPNLSQDPRISVNFNITIHHVNGNGVE